MEFRELVGVYDALLDTSSTLEKTRIIADVLEDTDSDLLPMVVQLLRGQVSSNWESIELGVSSSLAQEAINTATGIDMGTIEEWWRESGDLGDAAMQAVEQKSQQSLVSETLAVVDVYETLRSVSSFAGSGSQSRRVETIAGLLSNASPREARYIIRTVLGTMRLGVGDGILRDAVAKLFVSDSVEGRALVQRSFEVTNDFSVVVEKAAASGSEGLASLDIRVFRPVQPMLAEKAESMETAINDLSDSQGRVLLEMKYDGMRAKLHKQRDDVRMFTRRLEEVTEQFPDVVSKVNDVISAEEFIVEAEVVGVEPETGTHVPFQELSRRIKRKHDIEAMIEELPVEVYLFDLLYLDGTSLLDESLRARLDQLTNILDESSPSRGVSRAEHTEVDAVSAGNSFYERALSAGMEGVMIKNLEASYQPGSRVGYQRKLKPTMDPLDLVVTRVKWSEGRKSEYLGRPYLACRDTDSGDFKEIGRLHTGFTDADLEEFTELIEPKIVSVSGREAEVTPEIVLEVEYEEIQSSPQYSSGYALRFPRFKQIRYDLSPEDVDTLSTVKSLYAEQ